MATALRAGGTRHGGLRRRGEQGECRGKGGRFGLYRSGERTRGSHTERKEHGGKRFLRGH